MTRCEHTLLRPQVSLNYPFPQKFKTQFGVSKSARHQAQRYSEQGLEASSTKCRFPPYRVIFSNAVLPGGLETRTRVFDPETWEGSGDVVILSTHQYARHDWQTVRENPTLQDSLRSLRTRATSR